MKTLHFSLSILLLFALPSSAQTGLSAEAEDSSRFDYVSERVKNSMLAVAPPDSFGQARALKMFGRWETFWDTRASHNAPPGTPGGLPASLALDYYLTSGHSSCLPSSSFKVSIHLSASIAGFVYILIYA